MDKNHENQDRPLAVVTGASDGIGYELARQFAEHGFDLLIAAEDLGIVEAEQAFRGMGCDVQSVQVDLSKPEGVERLYQRIKAAGRPVAAIAINAGIGVSGDFVRETALEAELKLIGLNVTSVVHLTKLVAKDMVLRNAGKILITSSIASTMPAPFLAVYGASKAFVQSFAAAIRNELKDTGVSVTALMPGPTDTDFFERAGMEDTKVGASESKDDPATVAEQGFAALMAGKDQVIAGSLLNKMQGLANKVIPDAVKAAMHRRLTEPGSAPS